MTDLTIRLGPTVHVIEGPLAVEARIASRNAISAQASAAEAQGYAEDAQSFVESIGPTAGPFVVPAEAIVSDRAYPIQVAVLNGLGFTRLFTRLTMEGGTGSVEVMVLVNGVAVTPLIVLTHGESTSVISATVPPGGVLELWFGTIIGTPLSLFGKLEGPAA